MYCRKCGAELPEGARFCTSCGCDQQQNVTPVSGNSYPMTPRPDNNLWLAVLVTVLCCLPFGIVSIIYSSKVDSSWAAGDIGAALEYSRKARSWAWWGIGVCVLWWVLYLVVFVLILGTGLDFWSGDFSFDEFI